MAQSGQLPAKGSTGGTQGRASWDEYLVKGVRKAVGVPPGVGSGGVSWKIRGGYGPGKDCQIGSAGNGERRAHPAVGGGIPDQSV